jgi:riboflavin synthase
MFTGIIQAIGTVRSGPRAGRPLRVALGPEVSRGLRVSDSVAVDGVCLTVTELARDVAAFDVVPETLARSSLGLLRAGARVNLERAIRAGEPFGGHFVQGHVDGRGTVLWVRRRGAGKEMAVGAPWEFLGLVIPQGSVAVNGVSLTVASLEGERFRVALVPFTLRHTTLGGLRGGETVNLEADVIGKWVRRILGESAPRRGALFVPEPRPRACRFF